MTLKKILSKDAFWTINKSIAKEIIAPGEDSILTINLTNYGVKRAVGNLSDFKNPGR